MAHYSLSSGTMARFRLYLNIVGIFFILVTSLDSFAATQMTNFENGETYNVPFCQRALSYLNFRIIKGIDGRNKLVFKIPAIDDQHKSHYNLFYNKGLIDVELKNHNNSSQVREATEKFPEVMNAYGFYIREGGPEDGIYSLGTEAFNLNAIAKMGTPLERPFHVVDGTPDKSVGEKQLATDLKFLGMLRYGLVWLATGDGEFIHDRFQAHMVALIFMPKIVFENFLKQAEFVLRLRDIFPEMGHTSSIFVNKLLASRVEEIMGLWEKVTSTVGEEIAKSKVGYKIFLSKNSEVLRGYQSLAGESADSGILKKIADELERGGAIVTDEQKTQLERLYRQTQISPLTLTQIRAAIIDQLVAAGVSVNISDAGPL